MPPFHIPQTPGPRQTGSKHLPLIAGVAAGLLGLVSLVGAIGGGPHAVTADPPAATSAPIAGASEDLTTTAEQPVAAESTEPEVPKASTAPKAAVRSTPKPKPTPTPSPTPKPKPKPKPTMTMSQQQAIGSAQDYLEYQAFSRKGLIKQLSSKYGEGFSKKDATFAVDHISVNWNKQAAKAAENYLEFQHFSRAGLIQQLESEYGEGFTHAQAVYGVDRAGL